MMYEVDHLWVGEETNTGDAIAMRFTEPRTGAHRVAVIDGGFHETGHRLASHIESYYDTDVVDLAVCTHPDQDHINGLFELIEDLTVRRLLIHRPGLFGYGPNDGVKADKVNELVRHAEGFGVTVDDSYFAGTTYFEGSLTIAGPSIGFYKECLREQKNASSSLVASLKHSAPHQGRFDGLKARSLFSDPGEGVFHDHGGDTPRNNSSIVIDLQVDDARVLFTGDAGVPALTRAADKLDEMGRSTPKIDLVDVPHHGSRHNLNAVILDRLLGPRYQADQGVAVASVGKKAYDHPRPSVANALKRRGYPVFATRGMSLWWHSDDAPARFAYGTSATPLDWLDESKEDSGAA
jgi:hypothetical protein